MVRKPYSAQQLEHAIREACCRAAVLAASPASMTMSAAGRA
jgi:hypothetical protein